MSVDKEDVLATLVAARVLLDVEGWHQEGGNAFDLMDKHCALTAVCSTRHGAEFFGEPIRVAAVSKLGFADGTALYEWNDHPKRTKAQVLKAFDKAIAKLEKEMS